MITLLFKIKRLHFLKCTHKTERVNLFLFDLINNYYKKLRGSLVLIRFFRKFAPIKYTQYVNFKIQSIRNFTI